MLRDHITPDLSHDKVFVIIQLYCIFDQYTVLIALLPLYEKQTHEKRSSFCTDENRGWFLNKWSSESSSQSCPSGGVIARFGQWHSWPRNEPIYRINRVGSIVIQLTQFIKWDWLAASRWNSLYSSRELSSLLGSEGVAQMPRGNDWSVWFWPLSRDLCVQSEFQNSPKSKIDPNMTWTVRVRLKCRRCDVFLWWRRMCAEKRGAKGGSKKIAERGLKSRLRLGIIEVWSYYANGIKHINVLIIKLVRKCSIWIQQTFWKCGAGKKEFRFFWRCIMVYKTHCRWCDVCVVPIRPYN